MKTEKQIRIIILVGVILTILSPFLFTLNSGIVDFSSTGNIGDTIGGITSPIVGLVGAILVYYALKAQIDANAIIQKQLNEQRTAEYDKKIVTYLTMQLNMIREDINDFEFIEPEKINDGKKVKETKLFKGSEAINKYLELITSYHSEAFEDLSSDIYQLAQLKLLLELIDNFLSAILSEEISLEDKKYLLYNIKYLYKSKIKPHLDYYHDPTDEPYTIYQLSYSIEKKLNNNTGI